MDGKLTEYLDRYEKELRARLTELCTELRFMNGQLLVTDDLDEVWTRCAPEYMADAVPNIAQYPSAALAWAAYFGMAVARLWDRRWDEVQKWPDPYAVIRDARGFDEMDEYITEEIRGYLPESRAARDIENLMVQLARTAETAIRREEIEPQSETAFHIFARTVRTLYRIGASVELYMLGYKYVKVN